MRVFACVRLRGVRARSEGLDLDALNHKAAVARMVHDAANGALIIKPGDVDKDDLREVLKLVSSRLTANATKDDGSPTQLFLHFDEFDLNAEAVRWYFDKIPTVLGRYYSVWQYGLMPILRTPNLHLIVTGRPLELALMGRQGKGQSPCVGQHVVLGALKEEHLVEVGVYVHALAHVERGRMEARCCTGNALSLVAWAYRTFPGGVFFCRSWTMFRWAGQAFGTPWACL